MKISCQSCQAKYTIADEKVLGKIVKIRCKKCGATIVINGNDPEAASAGGSPAAAGASSASDSGYGVEQDQWTVNVADGDQRTMTVSEIVDEYKLGTIHDDTFCWKDGMNDWLPLREIESLYGSCTSGSAPGSEFSPLSLRNSDQDRPEPLAAASPLGLGTGGFGGGGDSLFGGSAARPSPAQGGLAAAGFHSETNGNGAGLFDSNRLGAGSSSGAGAGAALAASSSTTAARRTGGGRGNQADLFGGVAQAGGEEDVMTSAAPVAQDGSKLTGQRNENSVLFSLGALTQKAPEKPIPSPSSSSSGASSSSSSSASSDGSGLIDIRALASSGGESEGASKSSRHVDDIMNLGGGGAFSAALAAPVLAPPPQDFGDLSSPNAVGGGQNKTLYIAIIVGCLLIGAAIIVAVLLLRPSVKDDPKLAEPGSTPTATAAPAPTPTTTTPPPADTAAAAPGAGGASQITPSPGTKTGGGGGSKTAGKSGSGAGAGATPAPGEDTATPPPVSQPRPDKPKSLAEEMNRVAGEKGPPAAAPQAAGGTAPFDRGAAAASLGDVNIASCKKGDGPTGAGHVKVTFQGSGTVSTVEVDTPPFSGTAVGGCIASKFRSAHVPPFAGPPVTVGKTFSLN